MPKRNQATWEEVIAFTWLSQSTPLQWFKTLVNTNHDLTWSWPVLEYMGLASPNKCADCMVVSSGE